MEVFLHGEAWNFFLSESRDTLHHLVWTSWQRWAVTLVRISITGIPPCFLSLNTSLDIKTVISKVSIPVEISRLKISVSWFHSQYQDSNFKSLDSSLNIRTKLWKFSILVFMSRLDSWIFSLCTNLETGSAKQKVLENATLPICKIFLFSKIVVTFELMLIFVAQ